MKSVCPHSPPGVETPLFRGEFEVELKGQKGMDVQGLAKRAIAGIESGKLEIRHGLANVLAAMSRLPAEYPGWMLEMWSQARAKQLEDPRTALTADGTKP